MTSQPAVELLIGELFQEDFLRKQIVREMSDLMSGRSDGHHVLGYEAGEGDLRDCVSSKLQSDPQQKADHRLTFREIPAMNLEGPLNGRELLAVRPRHGAGNVYEQTSARLDRDLQSKQPDLDRFGHRPASSGGNEAQRQAERDMQRAIAHAWTGQKPLTTSRPLATTQFGARGPRPTPATIPTRER
ncbi:hypothetical protein GCM10009744_04170 [Kribbella alba]|uniref:Uncharacterized protein n=1 Tax=Kribbella alba TaxID=190197 RepID=A0ABN2EWS4_9ACTN